MEKITFCNQGTGTSQVFSYISDEFILLGYEGMSAVEVLPAVHSGYRQNGSTIDNVRLGSRIITLRFALKRDTMKLIYSVQQDIMKVFSPLGVGKLMYQNDQSTYVLDDVIVSSPPEPINKYGTYKEYEVELTAANPIFRSNNLSQTKLLTNTRKYIYSSGTAPSEYYIELVHNSSTTIVKPKITHETTIHVPSMSNYTGDIKTVTTYIELDASYGDVGSGKYGHQIISTGYGKKGQESIITTSSTKPDNFELLDYASIGDITSGSTFDYIEPGANYFTLTTESGTPYSCTLYYYPRYIGV